MSADYRAIARDALKDAVSSSTSGAGSATYGGADDDEDEEDVEYVEDKEIRAAVAEALLAVAKEWTGPHEGEQGGTYWLNTETGDKRYQETKPGAGEGGGDDDGGEDTEEYDTGEYDVQGGWSAQFAEAVVQDDVASIGVRDIYENVSSIEDPQLVADAYIQELQDRNSKTATEYMESRLRALGEDPEAIKEQGMKQPGPDGGDEGDDGGEDGGDDGSDYPVEGFDSPLDNLDGMDGEKYDAVWESSDLGGTRGTGIKNREQWEAISDHATTEELEDWLVDNGPAFRDGDGSLSFSMFRDDQKSQMVAGLLYYRDDSSVDVDQVLTIHDSDAGQTDADQIKRTAKGVLLQLEPTVGAALATHTGQIKPEDLDGGTNGVYRSNSGNIGLEVSSSTRGSPNVLAHELGHSLHYMFGIGGGGSWGENDRGEPNTINCTTPDMDPEGTHTDDAMALYEDMRGEWDRYSESQLGGEVVDDYEELEEGKEYTIDTAISTEQMTLTHAPDGVGELAVFEDDDGNTKTFSPPEIAGGHFIRDDSDVESNVKQLRSYQAKGLHEFFTVTFAHWMSDKGKLRDAHPEMIDIYDEHFGPDRWTG